MSLAHAFAHAPTDRRVPIGRWVALVGLLLLEGMTFSVLFDSADLRPTAWPTRLVLASRWLFRPTLVTAFATACLGLSPARAALAQWGEAAFRRRPWWPLLVHFAAMAFFALLTRGMVGALADSPYADCYGVAWLASGLVSLGAWLGAMLPGPLRLPVARALARPACWGIAVGAASLLAMHSTLALWVQFHESTFRAVAAVLGVITNDQVCQPADFIVGVPSFQVRIGMPCSGYEGIGLIWVFLGCYLFLFRHELRFPAALLLLPVGTAVIWCANVLRIVALVLIGAAGYPTLALGGFHSQSGWIAFHFVGLGLVLASRRLGVFDRHPSGAGATDVVRPSNPVAPLVVPLLALIAATMLTGAVTSGGFDALYPARVVAVIAALAWFRRDLTLDRPSASPAAVLIGVGVFALWMALEPASAGPESAGAIPSGLRGLPAWAAAAWVAARVLGSVVTVPIVEELAFRGFLLRRLVDREFERVDPRQVTSYSVAVSSLAFGALHGRWLAGFIAGVAYAMAYRHRGRLGDAVVAHAVTNALIAGLVLASGRWSLWT